MAPRIAVALIFVAPLALVGCSGAAPTSSGSFELGSAIRSQCEVKDGGYPAAFCEPLDAAVVQLLAEPRDDAWAGEMEKLLDDMFRTDGKYWADIRSLVCRQTICAVEYAQDLGGPTLDETAYMRVLQWLEPTTGGMGFEVSPSSQHKVVTVMVWKKKDSERARD